MPIIIPISNSDTEVTPSMGNCLYQVRIQYGEYKCLKTEEEYNNYEKQFYSDSSIGYGAIGIALAFGIILSVLVWMIVNINICKSY